MKKENKKRIERGRVARELIALFRDIEEISEPLFMKNAQGILRLLGVKSKNYYLESYLNSRLKSLIDQGLILRKAGSFVLSQKGQKELLTIQAKSRNKKRRWDGRWRIVMFDVYESRKNIRDRFRRQLKEYGFIQLQRSVWIYPYECEDFIQLIKTDNNFGKNVRYGVLEALESDAGIKNYFDL